MKLDRLIVKDVFNFRNVDLDLESLGPGVFAVTGPNGAGKSALLETVPAVTWQRLPAREDQHPIGYATSRASRMEFWWADDGQRYRALINLDATTRATDGLLERVEIDGSRTRLTDGKISTMKQALGEMFPSYDLFIASSFAAQGRGDTFTRARPSQRKDLFAELLGLERLLTLAQTAASAAALVEAARSRMAAAHQALRAEVGPDVDFDAREAEVCARRDDIAVAHDLQGLRLREIEAKMATMADAASAHALATQQLASAEQRLAAARKARQGVLDAIAATDATRQKVADSSTAQRTKALTSREQDIARIATRLAATLRDLDEKIAGNQTLQNRAAEIRAAAAAYEAAAVDLLAAREALDQERTAQTETARQLRTVEQTLAALAPLEQAHDRAVIDAGLLEAVPCGGEGVYAACQLLQQAQEAQEAIERLAADLAPKAALADQVGALTRQAEAHAATIAGSQRAITDAQARQREHKALATYLQPLADSEDRVRELTAARAKAASEADDDRDQVFRRHEAETMDLDQQLVVADATHDTDRQALDMTLAVSADPEVDAAQQAVEAARADLKAVAAGHDRATALRAELAAARATDEQFVAASARCGAELETITRDRQTRAVRLERLDDLIRRRASLARDLMEWQDLAKSLGKGGLADLEIDAAGPSITALTNTLLTSCFGPRFSVELVTQVQKADGSGYRDEFTVQVADNDQAGQVRDISDLSGGERTIVQEALMLAISIYVNERSPHPIRTLFRDESGAALDPVNAVRYVAMLRKAREIGGLHAIYFISHNSEASSLGDAQIRVKDGQAVIVLPPFEEVA